MKLGVTLKFSGSVYRYPDQSEALSGQKAKRLS